MKRLAAAATLGTFWVTAVVLAPALALDGWHRTRDDGLAAAKQSGRPVLVVTVWKEKV